MAAGELRSKVQVLRRQSTDVDLGVFISGAARRARVEVRERGADEGDLAGGLAGLILVSIRVRADRETRRWTNADRLLEVFGPGLLLDDSGQKIPRLFEITHAIEPSLDGRWLDIKAAAGAVSMED